jgi:GH24 family phage-related lysozyme (muramidase)
MTNVILKDPTLLSTFYTSHEGFRPTPYWDGTGYAIGYGNHYNLDGSPVQPGQTINQADALNLANAQLPGYVNQAAGLVGVDNFNNLNPSQQAALADITANYGVGRVPRATIEAFKSGNQDQIDAAVLGQNNNCPRDVDRVNSMHGADPANVTRGGASKEIPANTKGGAAGSGSGCAGAGLGILGAIAGAGLLGGLGAGLNGILSGAMGALGLSGITGAMGSAFGAIGNVLGGGLSGILGQVAGPLNQLTGGVMQSLSSIGSGILPSLTGVLPSGITNIVNGALGGAVGSVLGPLNGILQNPLNLPNAIQQFAYNGGLNGMINRVANNMVAGAAFGGANAFVQQIGLASAFSGISNSVVGAAAEARGLTFGAGGPGGLGANFVNNNGIVSFGMSALTSNIPAAASNLQNLGTFSTQNMLRLQQPANVANQIVGAGLGDVTGLTQQLIRNNIPLAGIDNPIHDASVQKILNNISDPTAIGAVSSKFNLGTHISHLGQLTDMSVMTPDLHATGPSKNFKDLGQHFLSLGITDAKNFDQIGTALSKTDAGLDLNHLSQMKTPMYQPAVDTLNQTFGYGGGSIGELTMADFLGTPAGYVHNETLPVITNANNVIMGTAAGQTLNGLIVQLQTLLTGGYHVPGSAAVGDQPASADCININGTIYYTLDDAVKAMIAAIEAQLTIIKNSSDPTVQAAIQASEAAHAASCAQLLKENHHVTTFGMDIFAPVQNNPVQAYVFADGLQYYGQQTGYGQIGDYMERVAQDNIYGDAIKGAMRQGRNAAALESLGVNIERFKLPHSQYYRDPAGFYLAAYSGDLPPVPANLVDQIIPQTPQDIYVDARNTMLVDNGYDPNTMLPAQSDETYYDLQWNAVSPDVRESIGLSVLQQAVNSNVMVVGPNAYIIGLDRRQNKFATINQHGLVIDNSEVFVATMLSIANKVLYGDIGTTKYNTPFFTDQMIYGMLEMLSQVTPVNIDALASTLIGSAVLSGFMDKLRIVFQQLLQQGNTGLDRNIVAPWGGSGPDGQMNTLPRN